MTQEKVVGWASQTENVEGVFSEVKTRIPPESVPVPEESSEPTPPPEPAEPPEPEPEPDKAEKLIIDLPPPEPSEDKEKPAVQPMDDDIFAPVGR